jgi:alpha-N-arabinofuranosidase
MYPCPQGDSGDDRLYNNLVAGFCDASTLDGSALPCFAGGNVFAGQAQPSKLDASAVVKPEFDVSGYLEQKADGWYLTLDEDAAWRDEANRKPVTTELLGQAKVTGEAFENADGSPIKINTDYFGHKRDATNPYPGPFEIAAGGKRTIKVWPKAEGATSG